MKGFLHELQCRVRGRVGAYGKHDAPDNAADAREEGGEGEAREEVVAATAEATVRRAGAEAETGGWAAAGTCS
jgi:hypothetical protein